MGYLSCNAESAILTCDSYNWDRRKKTNNNPSDSKKTKDKKKKPLSRIREFSCAELESATGGFSPHNFLGKGSHGSVYRAVLGAGNGKFIAAVKRSTSAPAVDDRNNPAENEIEILSRVRNRRLVNLLGFASDSSDGRDRRRWIVVVEYMPNGSLFDLMHSNPTAATSTSSMPGWTWRIRVALQVAQAVESLHASNPPVIHRDIKSSNVLLDQRWNARLGDFGLALRGHVEDVRVRCTPPAGTLGYLDPCYLAPADLSTKSDVFSFGILLLELLSGRNAIDLNYSPPSVLDWAAPLIRRAHFTAICDPRLTSAADPSDLRHLALLAARCVGSDAENRPAMPEVVASLKLVYRRARAGSWSSLRRRVGLATDPPPSMAPPAEEEPPVVTVKGSRLRRSRKVSSVPVPPEPKGEGTGCRVGRSRSIGSAGEVESKIMGSSSDEGGCSGNGGGVVVVRRKQGGVVAALKKSRSMGILRSRPGMLHCNNKEEEVAFQFLRRSADLDEVESLSKLSTSVQRDSRKRNEEESDELPLIHRVAQ